MSCSDFEKRPDGCPQGRYVIVTAPQSLSILRVCEVEMWGSTLQVIELSQEYSDCPFAICKSPTVQDSTTKRCKSYPGGPCNQHDDCLQNALCQDFLCKIPKDTSCRGYEAQCLTSLVCGSQNLCKYTIYGDCAVDSDCGSGTPLLTDSSVVCDYFNVCKIAVGASCTQLDSCVAGSSCTNGTCADCLTTLSTKNGPKCDPLYLAKVCASDSDCNPQLTPRCNSAKCDCDTGLLPSRLDFSCGKTPGSACTNQNECTDKMTCAGGLCKLNHLERCSDARDFCLENNCDPVTFTCKKPSMGLCNSSKDCLTDSSCVPIGNEEQCRLPIGKTCDPQLEQCNVVRLLTCSPTAKTCVIMAGGVCDPDSEIEKCLDDLACSLTRSNEYKCNVARTKPCTSSKQCSADDECNAENKCTGKPGSQCTNNDECGPGALCDCDRQCRWKSGTKCIYDSYCTLGAICNANAICACIPERTHNPSSGTCEDTKDRTPKLVGSPCTLESRCVENAYCDAKIQACLCNSGFGVTAEATCLPGASTACVIGNNTTEAPCALGFVCDQGYQKCGIKIGYLCNKHNSRKSLCERGSLCDDNGVCTLELNSDCQRNKDLCMEGLSCSVFGQCRLQVNKEGSKQFDFCYAKEQCAPASYCSIKPESDDGSGECLCNATVGEVQSTDGQCYPKPNTLGGECSDNTNCKIEHTECMEDIDSKRRCLCTQKYVPDEFTFTCKQGLGSPCTSDDICKTGYVCDNDTCKIDTGQPCTGFGVDICKTGSVCSEDCCKIPLDGSCVDSESCEKDTICDGLYTCKRSLNQVCSRVTECTIGAACFNSLCKCNTEVSTEKSGVCEPKKKLVGALCENNNDCQTGANCTKSRCFCLEIYIIDYNKLTCVSAAQSTAEEAGRKASFVWLVLLCTLLAMCASLILVAVMYRIKTKRDKKEVTRRQSLSRLELIEDTEKRAEALRSAPDKSNGTLESGAEDTTDSPESSVDGTSNVTILIQPLISLHTSDVRELIEDTENLAEALRSARDKSNGTLESGAEDTTDSLESGVDGTSTVTASTMTPSTAAPSSVTASGIEGSTVSQSETTQSNVSDESGVATSVALATFI